MTENEIFFLTMWLLVTIPPIAFVTLHFRQVHYCYIQPQNAPNPPKKVSYLFSWGGFIVVFSQLLALWSIVLLNSNGASEKIFEGILFSAFIFSLIAMGSTQFLVPLDDKDQDLIHLRRGYNLLRYGNPIGCAYLLGRGLSRFFSFQPC